ncbi:ABC transporter substrate-binding protein [Streptomyces sp. NPDC005811]|uniref:ABC transporter substrate-binding protein n=1 Tax=Streptomyces sp. NPDC005811 TaxID=3154565 RepID=UPI00340C2A8C
MEPHNVIAQAADGRRREPGDGVSRRGVLRLGATGILAAAGTGLLTSCQDTSGGAAPAATVTLHNAAPGGTPAPGGTLRVGMIGAGESETVNPLAPFSAVDIARVTNLYDRLFETTDSVSKLVPALGLSVEPNKSRSVWTLQLREGVTFHNGKPFTADDVIHSLRLWSDPSVSMAVGMGHYLDLPNIRKRGKLTVEIALVKPVYEFDSMLSIPYVVQDGATADQMTADSLGTGPFKLESFNAGQRSVFSANRDYWEEGKPHVDELVIDSSYNDEDARINALKGGEIDVAPSVPPVVARQIASSTEVTLLRSPSASPFYFCMRTDTPPFNDVRVRQAMRLVVDRKALINGALAGYGTVGNDLVGVGSNNFAKDLKRPRDVEKAKALLKAAGQESLKVKLHTSDVFAGATESATLFADQASAAGITVEVQVLDPSIYFLPSTGWPHPFGLDVTGAYPSLTTAYSSMGQLGETAWDSTKDTSFNAAVSATDEAAAAAQWKRAQQEQFETGGLIVWAQPDWLDAVGTTVRGLKVTVNGPLNSYCFRDGWLAK